MINIINQNDSFAMKQENILEIIIKKLYKDIYLNMASNGDGRALVDGHVANGARRPRWWWQRWNPSDCVNVGPVAWTERDP